MIKGLNLLFLSKHTNLLAKTIFVLAACLVLASAGMFQVKAASPTGFQTVDTGGVGYYASLAMDSQGNPGISYYDAANQDLKYAHWNGLSWDIQIVEDSGATGYYTSLLFDSNNYPQISFYGQNALKYARWTGTSWDIQVVDLGGNDTSIALDDSAKAHVSYFDAEEGDLKYASWNGTNWIRETVDSAGVVGRFTSLKFASNGTAYISYYDQTNGNLKIAWKNVTGVWQIQTIDDSANDVGQFSSLALDSNDVCYISYYDATAHSLKYAKSTPLGWINQTADLGNVGMDNSIAVDQSGNIHFSYTDNSTHLLRYGILYANYTWIGAAFLQSGYLAEYTTGPLSPTSLKVATTGDVAYIAYHDALQNSLKYVALSIGPGGDVDVQFPSANLIAIPNPAFVNQSVALLASYSPPPPSNQSLSGIWFSTTYPNGTEKSSGPFSSSTGIAEMSFVPFEVGSYSIYSYYTGQYFSGSNVYYLPTISNAITLEVINSTETINTTLSLAINPNPGVVNQVVAFNATAIPAPPTGETFSAIYLSITYPNGAQSITASFASDESGSALINFIPTETGNYTIQAIFAGQEFPTTPSNSVIYSPATSNPVLLVVNNATEPSPTPTPTNGGDGDPDNSGGSSSSSSSSSNNQKEPETTPTPTPKPQETPTPTFTPTPEPTQRRVFLDNPYAFSEILVIGLVVFLVCLGVMLLVKRWE